LVYDIEKEIPILNAQKAKKMIDDEYGYVSQIKCDYNRSTSELMVKINHDRFDKIDDIDLDFINDVVYRHKHNMVISIYVFQIRKEPVKVKLGEDFVDFIFGTKNKLKLNDEVKRVKKFVRIQQIHTLEAIMEVSEHETEEDLVKRIKEHCDNNGGAETVICCGGSIHADVQTDRVPTRNDEESYEVID